MPDRALGPRFVLAVDIGTGGPKVGLVSLDGVVAWNEFIPVGTDRLPDGGVSQDAELWWRLIVEAARRGLGTGAVSPEQIVAVSVTGQWASTIPVDAHGHPVGGLRDVDGHPGRGPHPPGDRRAGGRVLPDVDRPLDPPHRRGAVDLGADPIGHILHLEHDQPEVPPRPAGTSSRSTTCRCGSPASPPPPTRR